MLAVEDRKRDFDEKAALMQAKCGEQLTQTIRCFRKWELSKAQRRDLAVELETVDPMSPYLLQPPPIRCPGVQPSR